MGTGGNEFRPGIPAPRDTRREFHQLQRKGLQTSRPKIPFGIARIGNSRSATRYPGKLPFRPGSRADGDGEKKNSSSTPGPPTRKWTIPAMDRRALRLVCRPPVSSATPPVQRGTRSMTTARRFSRNLGSAGINSQLSEKFVMRTEERVGDPCGITTLSGSEGSKVKLIPLQDGGLNASPPPDGKGVGSTGSSFTPAVPPLLRMRRYWKHGRRRCRLVPSSLPEG